jgi:myo-inositol 2-dehydrogenase / D-chiro-inositol 1-dehydrogenase
MQPRPTWGQFLSWEWGGGALFDLGVHPLAVAMLLAKRAGAGEPVSVACRLEGADDIPTDEHAELTLRFSSGLVARVVSSWRGGDQTVWDFQAASATGVVRGELLPTPTLEHDGEPVPLPPLQHGGDAPQLEQYGYVEQLRSFLADFEAGREPAMSASFGRAVLDVVCAAYLSAHHDGAEQPLPYEGPRDKTPLELWRGV